jgi:hypothetical protein
VLHKLPPPDTTVRRRRGYRQLDPEDDTDANAVNETPDGPTIENDEDHHHDTSTRETVQHDGWRSLVWSFVASGSMTVGNSFYVYHCGGTNTFFKLLAYFFPVMFAIPLFGNYLAREWLWYFTPSLSYVGQGSPVLFHSLSQANIEALFQ